MSIFYVFLAIILIGLMSLAIFVLGAMFAKHFMDEAYEDARYDRLREEYYRQAGYRNPGDPKPYFPPRVSPYTRPRTPRKKMLPGMDAIDRLLHEGKRGTVMWKPADRRE